MEKRTLTGFVSHFDDQAGEGFSDLVFMADDRKTGCGGMHEIENHDWLKIFDDNNNVLFNGEIDRDYDKDCRRRFTVGIVVSWTQRGWEQDDWLKLFSGGEKGKPLRAELTKKKKAV